MLTKEQYDVLREKINVFNKWVDSIRNKKSGWASYKPEDIPADLKPAPTNEEISSVEVYEFIHEKPERYFLYIGLNPNGYTGRGSQHTATTWTGEYLGDVTFGAEFSACFGDKRISITVKAINGCEYHGTYFKSSGDYARIVMAKRFRKSA